MRIFFVSKKKKKKEKVADRRWRAGGRGWGRRGGAKGTEGRGCTAEEQSFSTSLSFFYVPSELLPASPFVSGLAKVTDGERSGIRLITPTQALPSLLHALPSFPPHVRRFEAHTAAIRRPDEDARIKGNPR